MLPILRLTILEAYRTRLPYLWLGIVLLSLAIGAFVAQLALIEQHLVEVSMVAPLLRLLAMLVVIFQVCAQTVREMEERQHWVLLAHALSRWQWLAGRMAGHMVVAGLTALCLGALVWLIWPRPTTLVWHLSLALECSLLAAIAYLLALVLRHLPRALFACLMVYSLGRFSSVWLSLSETRSPLIAPGETSVGLVYLMQLIDALVPKFEQFTQTTWLLAATPAWGVLQTPLWQWLLYVGLLFLVAVFDLQQREL
ncbi:hypothetical protein [Parvibium lacunae]|uniref:Uncharacterized protein n=1 Tax=Parvibium lacunae TaxID=1888893 RepID=A0A368L114_9BURK|nr:hypothetical protein [Parvibium lacunae]RCS56799.1 hypothetical protein DU000_10690 [Parvibium lacunae]